MRAKLRALNITGTFIRSSTCWTDAMYKADSENRECFFFFFSNKVLLPSPNPRFYPVDSKREGREREREGERNILINTNMKKHTH